MAQRTGWAERADKTRKQLWNIVMLCERHTGALDVVRLHVADAVSVF